MVETLSVHECYTSVGGACLPSKCGQNMPLSSLILWSEQFFNWFPVIFFKHYLHSNTYSDCVILHTFSSRCCWWWIILNCLFTWLFPAVFSYPGVGLISSCMNHCPFINTCGGCIFLHTFPPVFFGLLGGGLYLCANCGHRLLNIPIYGDCPPKSPCIYEKSEVKRHKLSYPWPKLSSLSLALELEIRNLAALTHSISQPICQFL